MWLLLVVFLKVQACGCCGIFLCPMSYALSCSFTVILCQWHVVLSRDCGILQVAQVLLTLPYSFSQLGMVSGVLFQIFYGLMGSWTAYLISVLYVEYRSRKEKENVSFKNHVIQVIISVKSKLFNLWVC